MMLEQTPITTNKASGATPHGGALTVHTQSDPLPRAEVAPDATAEILKLVDRGLSTLLRHPYFEVCRAGAIEPSHMLGVLQQLYCFSTMFERLLARRLGRFSSRTPEGLIATARQHLQHEIGHPVMFRQVLLDCGMRADDIEQIQPSTHIMALYGYMIAVIEYEAEAVASVALFQILEATGLHFFEAMLPAVKQFRQSQRAFVEHAEHDADHSRLGVECIALLDTRTRLDCRRVIRDLFCLLQLVLDGLLSP